MDIIYNGPNDVAEVEVENADNADNADLETIVEINGCYGVLDWQGFHPSPEPSFDDEVRRNPVSAMKNRRSRAMILQKQGHFKKARKLREEAEQIKRIIDAKHQLSCEK
ncbi:MAG: hypothetical protein CEN87_739 [Parcubacteria group bacterium Licking1014_1]|nr:MAG: hypothetical protein CEN87_739 [Parcubacteria group bacterium Licking1014_1]